MSHSFCTQWQNKRNTDPLIPKTNKSHKILNTACSVYSFSWTLPKELALNLETNATCRNLVPRLQETDAERQVLTKPTLVPQELNQTQASH